ncbi:MAG TPA: o-succinylbenzoate--CoA ligase [Chloroflexota bacterium]|nr:o-succinylbenzoate--CoA ligase [Chloroflexota bacterium]
MTTGTTATGMYMPEWLARRAAERPEALAVIDAAAGLRWTFAELEAQATSLARHLERLGIGKGDRVAAMLTNGARHVALVHALIRLGAVLVPINLRLVPSEVAWQLTFARARALVHDDASEDGARAAAAGVAGVALIPLDRWQAVVPAPHPAPSEAAGDDAAAAMRRLSEPPRLNLNRVQCVMFTSGTTGRPKGVLLTYGNHWWSAMASVLNLGLREDDRWLVCLPLFHVGGLAMVMRGVIYGIPLVFPPVGRDGRGFDPAAVSRTITAERVTLVSVVTVMLQRLLDFWGNDPHPPTLRCALLGGGPVAPAVLEDCARRGLPVAQSFGMTETASQVAALSPIDALRKLGSSGRPLLPNEIRIRPLADERGARVSQERLEGEILVRGPSVTPGYLGADGDLSRPLAAVDDEGWLPTGDSGRLDHEGYLYVLDRRADLIISGGENVSPAEVEAVLLSHPGIVEAGVFGIPDPRWGQGVAAAVVGTNGVTLEPEEVRDFCRSRLAGYKVPSQIMVAPALPRNAAGKLLRRQLREEASRAAPAPPSAGGIGASRATE